MHPTAEDALRAGEAFVATTYPGFDANGLKPVVKSSGAHWVFSYVLPDDMLGGAPVVEMDQATLYVIRTYRTQ